jgi:hypothetical protein
MATHWYGKGVLKVVNGQIDLDTDTLKVMLVNEAYTTDKDHEFASSVSSYEISTSGYAGGFGGSGRKTATVATQYNATDDRVEVVINDITWSSLQSGVTIGAAILIKEVTNDAASPIIAVWDFTTNIATNGGDFTMDFNGTTGNLYLTV